MAVEYWNVYLRFWIIMKYGGSVLINPGISSMHFQLLMMKFFLMVMCWLDMVGGVIFNIASSGGGGGKASGGSRGKSYDDYED